MATVLHNHKRTSPTRKPVGPGSSLVLTGAMWNSTLLLRAVGWTPTAKKPRRGEEPGSWSKAAFALGRMASTLPSLGPLPSPVPRTAAASQQDPGGCRWFFGLCLHQQWPNILSLQTAKADVGMEMLLVLFTAEELSHEA